MHAKTRLEARSCPFETRLRIRSVAPQGERISTSNTLPAIIFAAKRAAQDGHIRPAVHRYRSAAHHLDGGDAIDGSAPSKLRSSKAPIWHLYPRDVADVVSHYPNNSLCEPKRASDNTPGVLR